ncbi:unnamed protein product [Linum tenue]|uniref:Uncharacterized protein n=1 Tax=Linum tenue TaxID=586396 RepID=A0AAV0R749_9ROSI|nr:unnamed protein product [Linum tenue]CAI0552267.1 unnamed protein product [Linum tenue]
MRRKNQCSFGLVAKCAKLNHRPQQEAGGGEEEDWIDVEFGKLVQEKCRERKGVVELLECLEAEAIMGDDQGKNPTDYNRRAQIFDTSSRVFQALKQQDTTTAPPQSQG